MLKLFTFEHNVEGRTYKTKSVMKVYDARRYVAAFNVRIVELINVERVGMVETDDMYDIPIFGDVYRTEDGRLILEDGSSLREWQKNNILPLTKLIPLEEEIMI